MYFTFFILIFTGVVLSLSVTADGINELLFLKSDQMQRAELVKMSVSTMPPTVPRFTKLKWTYYNW